MIKNGYTQGQIDFNQMHLNMSSQRRYELIFVAALLVIMFILAVSYFAPSESTSIEENGELTSEAQSLAVLMGEDICANKGGVVVASSTDSNNVKTCVMANGDKCTLTELAASGDCQVASGVVLGMSENASPTPTVTPIIESTKASNSASLYEVQVTRKPNSVEPIEPMIKDYLTSVFGWRKQEDNNRVIIDVYYDATKGNPYQKESKYYFTYYIQVLGEKIETPITYEDYATIVRVDEGDQGLISYLIDPGYCETNEDCVVRKSFCTYGAFNKLDSYVDSYACSRIEDQFDELRVFYAEKQNCKAERVFADPVCINNLCQPTKEAARCIEKEAL
jgi:hypothetical protein